MLELEVYSNKTVFGCIVVFHELFFFFFRLLKPKQICPFLNTYLKKTNLFFFFFSNVLRAFNKPSMTPEC